MKKSSFGKEEINRRCNVFRKGVKGNLSKKCFWVRCTANECFCQKGEIVLSSRIKTDCVASPIGKRTSLHPCVKDIPDCFICKRGGEATSPANSL